MRQLSLRRTYGKDRVKTCRDVLRDEAMRRYVLPLIQMIALFGVALPLLFSTRKRPIDFADFLLNVLGASGKQFAFLGVFYLIIAGLAVKNLYFPYRGKFAKAVLRQVERADRASLPEIYRQIDEDISNYVFHAGNSFIGEQWILADLPVLRKNVKKLHWEKRQHKGNINWACVVEDYNHRQYRFDDRYDNPEDLRALYDALLELYPWVEHHED